MFGSVWHGVERLAKIHNRYWLALGPLLIWGCALSFSLIAHSNWFSLKLAIFLHLLGMALAFLAQGQWKVRAFEPDLSRFMETGVVGLCFFIAALFGSPYIQVSDYLFYIVGLFALGSIGVLVILARNLLRHPNLR